MVKQNSKRFQDAVEAAVAIIHACGRSPAEPALRDTPLRFAEFLVNEFPGEMDDRDFLQGQSEESYDEMVVEKNIPFMSFCEHHLLPFYGVAHVSYIPNGVKLSGLSKLARLVYRFAGTLTIQERITKQVADYLEKNLSPLGVMVILEATHLCTSYRGARALGASYVTSAIRGVFSTNPAAKAEMQQLLRS